MLSAMMHASDSLPSSKQPSMLQRWRAKILPAEAVKKHNLVVVADSESLQLWVDGNQVAEVPAMVEYQASKQQVKPVGNQLSGMRPTETVFKHGSFTTFDASSAYMRYLAHAYLQSFSSGAWPVAWNATMIGPVEMTSVERGIASRVLPELVATPWQVKTWHDVLQQDLAKTTAIILVESDLTQIVVGNRTVGKQWRSGWQTMVSVVRTGIREQYGLLVADDTVQNLLIETMMKQGSDGGGVKSGDQASTGSKIVRGKRATTLQPTTERINFDEITQLYQSAISTWLQELEIAIQQLNMSMQKHSDGALIQDLIVVVPESLQALSRVVADQVAIPTQTRLWSDFMRSFMQSRFGKKAVASTAKGTKNHA